MYPPMSPCYGLVAILLPIVSLLSGFVIKQWRDMQPNPKLTSLLGVFLGFKLAQSCLDKISSLVGADALQL